MLHPRRNAVFFFGLLTPPALFSLLAGLISFLAGFFTLSSPLAPLPLIVVGLRLHPLAALVGGAFSCTLLSATTAYQLAFVYAAVTALPAFTLSIVLRTFINALPSSKILPSRASWTILRGIAVYAILLTLAIALYYDAYNKDDFKSRLKETTQTFLGMRLPPEATPFGAAEFLSEILPSLYAGGVVLSLTLSACLGIRIAQALNNETRLKKRFPPFSTFLLPLDVFWSFPLSFTLWFLPGYFKLAGVLIFSTLMLTFLLAGFAMIFFHLRKWTKNIWLTNFLCILFLFLPFSFLLIPILGVYDTLLDSRRLREHN